MADDDNTLNDDAFLSHPFVPFPEDLVSVHVVRRRNRFVIEAMRSSEDDVPAGTLPDGEPLLLHMPNTGRMTELLTPGTLGLAALDGGGERKTAGTLLLVRYEGRWVSVDARMPNRLFDQGMKTRFLRPFVECDAWRAEVPWGKGRIDFQLWPSDRPESAVLVETKSCNLVVGDTALFPDAPTIRGARHLLDLAAAVENGRRAAVVWFVQRDDARRLAPHRQADPAFGDAFDEAVVKGVEMYAYRCRVTPEGITVLSEISVEARAPEAP